MEELEALRSAIVQHRYADAIVLIDELESMSREDKLEKIDSYLIILMLHIIKQVAEQRSTRSWEASIRESARRISRINKRRSSGGYYLSTVELKQAAADAYPIALNRAALEAFDGQYNATELEHRIDIEKIQERAVELVMTN